MQTAMHTCMYTCMQRDIYAEGHVYCSTTSTQYTRGTSWSVMVSHMTLTRNTKRGGQPHGPNSKR